MSVIEAPDDRTMIRITSTLAARGTLKTHTLGAIPIDDYIAALGDGVGGGGSTPLARAGPQARLRRVTSIGIDPGPTLGGGLARTGA